MADDPFSLSSFLESARARVDSALQRYLPEPPACPALISEAMRYSLFAGGKRLRPVLTLAAADATARARRFMSPAAAESAALPAACAIELIHTYSLIHDDLPAMDDAELRRGRPTVHVVYGEAIAVLAGDGLHAQAFGVLAHEPRGTEPALVARKLRVLQLIADAAGPTGIVGGQAIDLQAAGQTREPPLALDLAGLQQMHASKTGALIRASAVSGAIMAGADLENAAAIDRYAAELGLAFQIIDDILDVEGATAELGKTAGQDAARGKPTYASLCGIARSRTLAAECVERSKAALANAGLEEGWLGAIADWVISRKN